MSTGVHTDPVQGVLGAEADTTSANGRTVRTGTALAPLYEPTFRNLWIAAIVSFTGTWMHTVASGWLMATMTKCPLWVALVQAASVLPVFLIILPAGVIADVADRRKLLLFAQVWMVLIAGTMGILTLHGWMSPITLLLFTFLLGLGAVLNDPAWQAITPDLVHHENLEQAVALNSTAFNVARAVGPAIGGVGILLTCPGWVFLINAMSFFGVILVIYRWKSKKSAAQTGGPIWHSFTDGLSSLIGMSGVRAVLVRAFVFSISACALTAMLPLLALRYGSQGYGVLLGCFGIGALLGACLLPTLRRKLSVETVVISATLLFAVVMAASAAKPRFAVLAPSMIVAGFAWLQVIAVLNVSAQTMSPPHMRARAISMYLLVLQGGMAVGSALWGYVARGYQIGPTLVAASILLVVGLVAAVRYRIHGCTGPYAAVAAD